MRVITLNCGSSSVKYSLWETEFQKRICSGIIEKVGLDGSITTQSSLGREDLIIRQDCPTHRCAIEFALKNLTNREYGALGKVEEIGAVGHRVVHGGEDFVKSVCIDKNVISAIEQCSELAPLHNPPNLLGIKAAMSLLPNVPHIAVFDTAFLSTLPKYAYIYPLPYEWYEKYRIRRYGFHGTSHLYVSRRASVLLGKNIADANLITIHIGNGVSVTAIRKGVAIDHSMGFTPLEGAVMGSRCGDIDPAIPLYIMRKENKSANEMDIILNKRSGLLGITGKYVDRRDIIEAANHGDQKAILAIEIECYRLGKFIGAYSAALGGADAIVFTAGVGENSPVHRAKICEHLISLGIELDLEKNRRIHREDGETDISAPEAAVKTLVIPTNEELVFVEDVQAILNGRYDIHTKFEYSFQKPGFHPIF